MDEPKVAQKGPYTLELQPGTYWWCACGRSRTQPFCDGSHKETDIAPIKIEITETRQVALCGCKHTLNKPYCDGAHDNLT